MQWIAAWAGTWFVLSVLSDVGGAMAELAAAFAITIALAATFLWGGKAIQVFRAGQ